MQKNIQNIKRRFFQVYVLALPDWQLLCQVLENTILHPITYRYLENYSIFTS